MYWYMKILILIVLWCLQNQSVLCQIYCPNEATFLPCTCTEYGIEDVRVDCSSAVSEDDIQRAFSVQFPLKNLSSFLISNNDDLTELTKDLFADVSFQQITIQTTSISAIDAMFFNSSYNTVTSIDCSYNTLRDFPFSALIKFTSLTDLSLNYDELLTLPLLSSATIQKMSFFYSFIETIEDFAFNDCPALTGINLNYNLISKLSPSIFIGATSLIYIYLQENQVKELRKGTFSTLLNLSYIDLYGNPTTNIDEAVFVDLPSLNYLNLGNTQVKSLGRHIFFDVHSITNLHLQNSFFQTIEPYTFVDFQADSIDIYLNKNNISYLMKNTFTGISRGNIYLHENYIADIETEVFRDLNNSLIDLHTNLISNLNEDWLGSILTRENDVDIRGNPLDCECDMAWLFLTPKLLNQLIYNPTCNNGTYIHDLDSSYYLINC